MFLQQENCLDLICDYKGNLYLLQKDAIIRFKRHLEKFDAPEIYPLGLNDAKDFAYACDKIILLSGHQVFSVKNQDLEFACSSDFVTSESVELPAKIIKAKENLILYSQPDCYHAITVLKEGEKAFVRTSVFYDEKEYFYIETSKGIFYLPSDGANIEYLLSGNADISYGKAAIGTVSVYPYPAPSARSNPIISGLGKDDIIRIVSYVAIDNGNDAWGWYKVEYGEDEGFVPVSALSEAVYVDEIHRTFYKISTNHLGEHINAYASPDSLSEVLFSLYDGQRVEMREELDKTSEFSRIWVDGKECFVKTSCLIQKGLTKVQSLALILFAVVLVAATIMGLLFYSIRRQKI